MCVCAWMPDKKGVDYKGEGVWGGGLWLNNLVEPATAERDGEAVWRAIILLYYALKLQISTGPLMCTMQI